MRYWVMLTTAKQLHRLELARAPALVARGLTPAIEQLGRINGTRAVSLERRYVAAFFDQCLKHRPTTLFNDPSPEPDVRIKR